MVLAFSNRIPRVRPYSGYHFNLIVFRLQDFHLLWLTFPSHSSILFQSTFVVLTPCRHGLGSFLFARRYLGNRCFFLFLQVLRCFSSLGMPPATLSFQVVVIGCLLLPGFPIRISPDLLTYSSLMRFAVCCVLLRLLVPRHPPCALSNLT
jgi:hypothetical protein